MTGPQPQPTADGLAVQRSSLRFPVVGIGASAGGLAALARLFEALPAASGMAFVVILHLSPKHKSHAAEILQRSAPIPVQQVESTVSIERDHVYVVPPTQQLAMSDGQLVLAPESRTGGRHGTVDTFFRTLADAHREHSVGVVLSGSGADGSAGIARIKEQGGVTLAQAPDDAEHESMPRAAIATGQVDFVLPAADIPAQLLLLAATARSIRMPADIAADLKAHPSADGTEAARDEQALREVMALLRARTGHDFRSYKRATVLRRLERRMQVCAATSLPAYRDFLREHPGETAALLQDMLISVTHFFRDRDAFEALERDVLRPLLERLSGQQLRGWVAGCATGEEAYSLAMLLQEACPLQPNANGYQLFATDIDERALQVARTGCYPASIAGDMTPTRLREHMTQQQSEYRVAKALRDRVLFAQHNLLRDPPFSRLHLVACRNLLIYLERDAQAQALETFHFALAPGGVLFLGSSETVEVASELFEPIDKRNRLYRARPGIARPRALLGQAAQRAPETALMLPPPPDRLPPYAELHQRAQKATLPASMLLDGEQNILHLYDGAVRYLLPPAGIPTLAVVANIHPSLRLELRAALFKAQQTGAPVEARAPWGGESEPRTVIQMVVRPYIDPQTRLQTLLVSFEELWHGGVAGDAAAAPGGPAAAEMEVENQHLKARLQDTLEQAESSTEELRSSNEELQAINEELRSATEELETSKEELQSVNEELATVNFELATKVDETGRVNDDLRNFVASADIAIVFVDGAMRIRRYTPRATELFNVIAGDIGRPLLDITHRLVYDEMTSDVDTAFASLRTVEREIATTDGRTLLTRLLPYRTAEDRIEGVVLTFVDVSARRAAELSAREGREWLRIALESTRDFAIAVVDGRGTVTHWNVGAARIFGYAADEIVGRPLALIYTDEDRAGGRLETEMREAAETGRAEDERWHLRKDGSRFYCSGVMTPFDSGGVAGYAKIARDMTAGKQQEIAREAMLEQEQTGRRAALAAVDVKNEFLAVMSHELKHPLNLIALNAEVLLRLPQLQHMEPAQRAARTILDTVAAQAKIVDDLLDLSRARTGKLSLQLAPVDWAATVRTIADAFARDAAAKGVQLAVEGAEAPLHASFDRVRAEQVVWNLLSNALKFTPAGGSVRVALAVEGDMLRLSVDDSGKGIDPAFIEHVFEMFAQESPLERRRDGGLGVGLALVAEIVAAHGGRVAAASPGLGQGATFTVRIPRGAGAAGTLPAAEAQSRLHGLELLLVDDSSDTVLALGTLLRLAGANVATATTGAEALQQLQAHAYDVVVSDVSMPEVSGLDLIRNWRARGGAVAQPLAIACSGYARPQDERAALDAGFDAKLSKPLRLAELEATLTRLLAARDR